MSGARRRALRSGAAIGLIAVGLAMSGCVTDKVSEVTASVGDVFATAEPQAPRHVPIFVVSTRKGKGNNANELADTARDSLQSITVPPDHRPGDIERAAFGHDNPDHDFTVSAFRALEAGEFRNEIASHLSGRVGSNRDILVYVHGFNTSYDDARFRLAQIVTDGRFGGVAVLFTWPATGSLFDYGAAKESAAVSREALAQTLVELGQVPDVGRIHILAHSMGAWLAMEALQQDAIAGDGTLSGKLGDVMLAAPDIDIAVFRQQMARLDASHLSIMVSSNDRALSLSRRLAGDRQRVGALDPSNAADKATLASLGVKVYDLSADSSGFVGHGTYASAPEVVKRIGAVFAAKRIQDADVSAVLGDRPIDTHVKALPLAPPPPMPAPPPIGALQH